MNYRIKQQYGYFVIEREFEVEIIKPSVLTYYFSFWFKRIITIEKVWLKTTVEGFRASFYNPAVKFKTIESAKECIENFKPVIHEYK